MRVLLIIMICSFKSYSQTIEDTLNIVFLHERFIEYLGKENNNIKKSLRKKHGLRRLNVDVEGVDSTSITPKMLFNSGIVVTLFLIKDTCTSIGVSYKDFPENELLKRFRAKYADISSEVDLEEYAEPERTPIACFQDLGLNIKYLVFRSEIDRNIEFFFNSGFMKGTF